MQVLQEMGNSTGLLCLVSTAAFNEDGDAGWVTAYLAILEDISSDATVMPFLVLDISKL